MAGRNIGRTGIDELAVNLVGEEEKIVFLHQIADALHLLAGVEVARGVVGVADQDAARALVDQFFELRDVGQRKTLFDRRDDRTDHGARRDGESHIVGVGRFGHDDFVAGVQARHEGEQHRFGTSRGDDDLFGRKFDLVLLVVARQLFAERPVTVAGAVFEYVAVDLLQRCESRLGRRQIGLADVEVVDSDSPRPGGFRQRNEFAYRRCRHQLGAL